MAEQMREEIEDGALTAIQSQLISSFYLARREASDGNRIPYDTINRISNEICYEKDLFIKAIQSLDDELIRLTNEKQQKEIEKIKNKKPR